MSVSVKLWGAIGTTALTLAAVPNVDDSVVVGSEAYPVIEIAYSDGGLVYAEVGPGVPFKGLGSEESAD